MTMRSTVFFLISMILGALVVSCGPSATTSTTSAGGRVDGLTDRFGVLVMAHGGDAEWNRAVLESVRPLERNYDVEVAFGMADATTLQAAVRKLEGRKVRRIGVVRMFVSGESFLDETEKILGLRPGAPDSAHGEKDPPPNAGHPSHGGHSMAFFRLATTSFFALSKDGLADAAEMGAVLADRASALSKDPAHEDVLVLAHGPGDDDENTRWMKKLEARAEAVKQRAPFRRVEVATLREDWPDKRVHAERRIHAFVDRAAAEGGTAIVIPFRVQGFGPYAKVLEGRSYVSDGKGLLPHPALTSWIARQIEQLEAGPFRAPAAPPR